MYVKMSKAQVKCNFTFCSFHTFRH